MKYSSCQSKDFVHLVRGFASLSSVSDLLEKRAAETRATEGDTRNVVKPRIFFFLIARLFFIFKYVFALFIDVFFLSFLPSAFLTGCCSVWILCLC